MRNILFICTGNTCRSPMAEAILKHYANDRYAVKSAGVFAQEGSPASQYSEEVLRKQLISIDHKSQQLNDDLIEWSDLILTMTNSHKQIVQQYFPRALDKVFSLLEYAVDHQKDISDPFGGTLADYQEIYKEIDEAIQLLLEKIEKE